MRFLRIILIFPAFKGVFQRKEISLSFMLCSTR